LSGFQHNKSKEKERKKTTKIYVKKKAENIASKYMWLELK